MKRVSLELGGHAPFLVFDDADLDAAVREVVASKFRNTGQTCVCANRIYVQAGIYDAFAGRALGRGPGRCASAIRSTPPPTSARWSTGPATTRCWPTSQDAVAKGARALVGGQPREGLFFDPTVLVDVAPGMRILQEETFGPIAPLVRFTRRRRGRRAGQRHPVRPGRLPVDPRPDAGLPGRRKPSISASSA